MLQKVTTEYVDSRVIYRKWLDSEVNLIIFLFFFFAQIICELSLMFVR